MIPIPRALLVGEDAELEHVDTKNVVIDPESLEVRLRGDVRLRQENRGQLRRLLNDDSLLGEVEYSVRSFQSRVGFDITRLRVGDAIRTDNGDLLMDADIVLYPGEDRHGAPIRNPLLEILSRLLADKVRLGVCRLFFRKGATALTKDQIERERREQRLMIHEDAQVVNDGVILPCDPHQFPLRFDLIDDRKLILGLSGLSRGVIDRIQPAVDRTSVLPPKGFRITSTKLSMGRGRRGVLDENIYDMRTQEKHPTARHRRSKLWDGIRTAGMDQKRHLEWGNEGWDAVPMFDDTGKACLGSKLEIYPAQSELSNGVSVVVPKGEFHRSGFTVDHWVKGNGHQHAPDRIRRTLQALREGDDWGVLVGPDGMRPIFQEHDAAYLPQGIEKEVELYGRHGGTGQPRYPVSELGEFLRQVGNHQQRMALFCRELPSPESLQLLVSQGVRIVFTDCISDRAKPMTITNSQLQHYKLLSRMGGLQLYVATPRRVRKLWNDLFVDIQRLDRLQQTEIRLGSYGSSAMHSEVLLQRGHFGEALREWLQKFPDSALLTGAAINGAMGHMNLVASELDMLTIGIANDIRGQETPDEELDAVVVFEEDDFHARQALMATMNVLPLNGPGAQGSLAESAVEFVMRKTDKTLLAPIPHIDPVGLGLEGEHLYAPLMQMQGCFNRPYDVGNGKTVVLSRSPHVEPMGKLVHDYREALQLHAAFIADPEGHWERWGVPEGSIRASLDRTLRDCESTGFPFPSFLRAAAERYGIRGDI